MKNYIIFILFSVQPLFANNPIEKNKQEFQRLLQDEQLQAAKQAQHELEFHREHMAQQDEAITETQAGPAEKNAHHEIIKVVRDEVHSDRHAPRISETNAVEEKANSDMNAAAAVTVGN